jgi:hypothetical protein
VYKKKTNFFTATLLQEVLQMASIFTDTQFRPEWEKARKRSKIPGVFFSHMKIVEFDATVPL